MPSIASNVGRLQNLQVLRGIAATIVVVYHTVGTGERYGFHTIMPETAFSFGPAGVDIFFVISGFIMVFIQSSKPRSAGMFLLNRMARIIPLYWMLTLTFFALSLLIPTAFKGSADFTALWQSLAFVRMYCDPIAAPDNPVLYVGWSLEFEMLFYVLFALGLALGKSLTRGAALAAAGILAIVLLREIQPVAVEFVFGVALGLWFQSAPKRLPRAIVWGAAVSGIVLIGFGVGVIEGSDWVRVAFWGTGGTALVVAALFAPPIAEGFLTRLGDASYSIYLVQVFTISAFFKAAQMTGLHGWAGSIDLACVIVTVIAGLGLWHWFEHPVGRISHRLLSLQHSRQQEAVAKNERRIHDLRN